MSLGAVRTNTFFHSNATFPLFFYVNTLIDRRIQPAAFLRRCVKLKEFQLLHAAQIINVSSKTVVQSEDPGGGATIARFCL